MSALIGFIARLPHALIHRCERMSVSTRDLKPAARQQLRRSPSTRSDRRAVELADRELVALDQADDARRVAFGGRIGDRPDDPVSGDVLVRARRRGRAPAPAGPRTGPGNFWKNHHGTPFCNGITTVSSWYSGRQLVRDLGDLVRLERQHDDVLRPEIGEIGRRLAGRWRRASVPSGSIESQPARRMAARLSPRASTLTS